MTEEQQDAIKAFHKELVSQVPHDKQKSLAMTLWSAIKAKYNVSYKDVPPSEFQGVLSLMTRVAVEKLDNVAPQSPEVTPPLAVAEQREAFVALAQYAYSSFAEIGAVCRLALGTVQDPWNRGILANVLSIVRAKAEMAQGHVDAESEPYLKT